MTIKIGDFVTVYDKPWIVNNVINANEIEKELPDIGRVMKDLGMRLVVLQGATKTIDLMIIRIRGQPAMTTVFVDNDGNFYDPDKVLPKSIK